MRTKRSHKGKVRAEAGGARTESERWPAASGPCLDDRTGATLEVAFASRLVSRPGVKLISPRACFHMQAPQRYEDSMSGSAPRTEKRPRTAKKFADE